MYVAICEFRIRSIATMVDGLAIAGLRANKMLFVANLSHVLKLM